MVPGELPERAAAVAEAAARTAGELLLEKFQGDLEIRHKGDVDLVTDADRAAEEAIVAQLRRVFPDHDILAEEGDYGELNKPCRWIIDPLDGTTNFAHGFPWFAVSIALEVSGTVVAGVVFNPWSKELYSAIRGQGARLNGRSVMVSRVDDLSHSLVATGFPYDRQTSPINNLDHFANFQRVVQGCRRPGVASLDLAAVAAGRFDGYWEMKLKPWDVAAGVLLVSEAGGRVSDFDGNRLDIYAPRILASNGLIHAGMQEVLRQGRWPDARN